MVSAASEAAPSENNPASLRVMRARAFTRGVQWLVLANQGGVFGHSSPLAGTCETDALQYVHMGIYAHERHNAYTLGANSDSYLS